MNIEKNKGKKKDTKNFIQILSIIEAQSCAIFNFYVIAEEEGYFRSRLDRSYIGSYEIGDVERFLLNDIPSRRECNNRYLHYLKTYEILPQNDEDGNKRTNFRRRVISLLYRYKWSLRQPPKQVRIL